MCYTLFGRQIEGEINMLLSDCCGESPRQYEDCGDDDLGICSDCKDHCTYINVCEECSEEECVCEGED